MVLNKIFGKKESENSIDSLKERFSQVSNNEGKVQGTTQPNSFSPPSQSVEVHDALGNPVDAQPSQSLPVPPIPQFAQQSPQPIQSQQAPIQPVFGQQPLGVTPTSQSMQSAAPSQPQQMPQQPIQQVQPVSQPSQPIQASAATDLPSWAVESTGEEIANEISSQPTSQSVPSQNKSEETLEAIEDKYYDAKLNSLIIDQVKELIEIDNNLNTKIDDVSAETKKEILEREHLAKKVDQHFEKVKELERNMEKFLGLYEMVTNQFNPFVDKGSSDMFLDDKDKQFDSPIVKQTPQSTPPIIDQSNSIPSELQFNSQPIQQAAPIQPVIAPQNQSASNQWAYCPIHHNIHPSMHFELKDGQKLSSIYDVLAVLEQMDDELFAHHVSLKHNDFSNWVYKVLGLTDLGQQLDMIKTKPEMIQSVRSYIQEKMKSANQ